MHVVTVSAIERHLADGVGHGVHRSSDHGRSGDALGTPCTGWRTDRLPFPRYGHAHARDWSYGRSDGGPRRHRRGPARRRRPLALHPARIRMSDRERTAPPDWALPGWDAVDPDEPVVGRPAAPRPTEAARARGSRPTLEPARGPWHVRPADPAGQRGHPGGPDRDPAGPAPRRPVGRRRDRARHGLERGPRLLRAEGRAQPAPVRLVPRRPRALRVRGPGRSAGRRPRARRPVRTDRRDAALRRLHPAGGARRPRTAVRGTQGAARGGGSLRHRAEAPAALPSADDRRRHQPVGSGVARHQPRPGASVAARPGRRWLPRRCRATARRRAS